MTRKVLYTAYYGGSYPFGDLADEQITVRDATKMTEKDSLLLVWGGADINPALYGHKKSRTTYYTEERDAVEWAAIQQAIRLGIPMLGICRGAQIMCAAAGGYLFQDVTGHAGPHHTITTYRGDTIWVNSLHHQMLGIENTEHELLAWSTRRLSREYIWKDDQRYEVPQDFKEPELVYFPKIKALAAQWHPEMLMEDEPSTQFLLEEWDARFSKATI